MKIVQNREADKLVIALEGRLDTTTAPEFDVAIESALNGVKELVLDMNKLEYISSAGLRVVLKTHKAMSKAGKLIIVGANENVLEVFDITGFADILNVE